MVEARFKNSGKFDVPSGMGCLGTIIVPFVVFIWSMSYRGSVHMDKMLLIAAAVLGGLGVIYTLVQLHLAPSRYVRSRITLAVLARALRDRWDRPGKRSWNVLRALKTGK